MKIRGIASQTCSQYVFLFGLIALRGLILLRSTIILSGWLFKFFKLHPRFISVINSYKKKNINVLFFDIYKKIYEEYFQQMDLKEELLIKGKLNEQKEETEQGKNEKVLAAAVIRGRGRNNFKAKLLTWDKTSISKTNNSRIGS